MVGASVGTSGDKIYSGPLSGIESVLYSAALKNDRTQDQQLGKRSSEEID